MLPSYMNTVWVIHGGDNPLLEASTKTASILRRAGLGIHGKLNGVRAAAKALGNTASREIAQVKKRVMSAVARAKISKASKARWAKFRAEKRKKAKAA